MPDGIGLPNLASYFSLSTGDYLEEEEVQRSIIKMKEYLSERGFAKNSVTVSEEPDGNEINLSINVSLGELSVVDSIEIISDNPSLAKEFVASFPSSG